MTPTKSSRGQRSAPAEKSTKRKGSGSGADGAELSGKTPSEVREALDQGVIAPLDLVMLTRERIEETFSEAVARGRITAEDARQLAQGLIERGQQQTSDVLRDLEQLLDRGRKRAATAADPVIAQADRARRAAGVGPSFPILSYDDLTVAQVQSRLGTLSPPDLRKVRAYERKHANRKSVLSAVETKLGRT